MFCIESRGSAPTMSGMGAVFQTVHYGSIRCRSLNDDSSPRVSVPRTHSLHLELVRFCHWIVLWLVDTIGAAYHKEQARSHASVITGRNKPFSIQVPAVRAWIVA